MGAISVELPDDLKAIVERQVADGLVADEAAFLVEAARRFAEELAFEDEEALVAEVEAAIADAEAGHYTTIANEANAVAMHQRTMARLRARLASDPG